MEEEHVPAPVSFGCGDVFVLDDLPPNFTIGCDITALNSAKPFLGFRDIPAGAHLIWVAPSESTSSRSGFWIFTPEVNGSTVGIVYVKQWDKFNEVLTDTASQAEERFQKERLEQMYGTLAPYGLKTGTPEPPHSHAITEGSESPPALVDNDSIWYQLTFAIRPEVLSRITTQANNSWSVATRDLVAGGIGLAEEARLYTAGSTKSLKFIFPIDAYLVNPSAAGAERTRQALDPTGWIIDKLEASEIGQSYTPSDLVGEFQFAFLTGMHLGNFSCLEQWWFLATRLVFRAYGLAIERPQLARQLIQTFHAQLLYNERHLDGGSVLEMMPEYAKKLQRALVTYKARLDESLLTLGEACAPDQHAVGVVFSSLEAWLWRLSWDLRGEYVRKGNVMLEDGEIVQAELSDFEDEDERGEFAPTVVEMGENGRETGLLSWD
ncbi:A1 cistron-splicing factor, partial [Xylariaceae sp. FL0255]